MKKSLFLASTVALSLSFSHLAVAEMHNQNAQPNNQMMQNQMHQAGDKSDKCPCPMRQKMHEQLNLTPDQQAKIKQIKDQARTNMQENHQAMKELNSKMRALIESERLDAAELDRVVDQKTALKAAKMKNKIMVKNQIYNLLTPEQKTKYSQMLEQKQQKYEKKYEKKQVNGVQSDNQANDVDDYDDMDD